MRNFVIVGHKATTNPNFSLEDIPGTSGRLDILCRSVTAAFVISHGIRKDVCVYLVLLGGDVAKTIRLQGETLRHLNHRGSAQEGPGRAGDLGVGYVHLWNLRAHGRARTGA
jgi:tRNA pseudouridine-54 N-methylase